MSQPPMPGHGPQGPDEGLPDRLDDDDLLDDFRLPGEAPLLAQQTRNGGLDEGAERAEESSHDAEAPEESASAPRADDSVAADGEASPREPSLRADAPGDDAHSADEGHGLSPDGGPHPEADDEPDAEDAWSWLPSGAGSTGTHVAAEGDDEARAHGGDPDGSDMNDEQRARREARRRDRRRRQLRGAVIIGAALLVLAFVATKLIGALLPGGGQEDFDATTGDEVTFTVNSGEGPILIGRRLEEEGIIASADRFQEITEATAGGHMQPGDYTLRERMTTEDAVRGLKGEARVGVSYVAVNPGQRRDEVIEAMAEATSHDVSEIEEATQHPERYGLPKQAKGLEGYLAAGEYRLPQTASVDEVLEEVTAPTVQRLEEHGVTDPEEQHRVLTIASILQAEARKDDFATVAGIIENRLAKDNDETHGYLQIDATVIYGLGEQRLQFSDEERRDKSNEYNTYQHKGLTPGPIGAPSTEAIAAAADPEDNDYYYWVTTNIDTGETKFATTYEEHQKYQNEYRRWCDDHPDVC